MDKAKPAAAQSNQNRFAVVHCSSLMASITTG